MDVRPFGNTGLTVPAIGMGTWQSLDVTSADDVAARRGVIDAAIAAGTTLFDTSPMYGASERVLGGLVQDRRDAVLIADKVWTASRAEAGTQADDALRWYGGRVDIYQVHNLLAWREHLPMLEDLRARGQVKVIGATHYSHAAFPELMQVMETGRIGMIQVPYSAADRAVERDVLPLAAQLGLGVLAMQPLGSGRLARKSPGEKAIERLRPFGVETWPQALLKWIVSDPRVQCAIPATSREARATENAGAGSAPWFDDETREYVARLAKG